MLISFKFTEKWKSLSSLKTIIMNYWVNRIWKKCHNHSFRVRHVTLKFCDFYKKMYIKLHSWAVFCIVTKMVSLNDTWSGSQGFSSSRCYLYKFLFNGEDFIWNISWRSSFKELFSQMIQCFFDFQWQFIMTCFFIIFLK